MEIPLLQDIVIILGLSVFIILLFQRLKLPAILGFLITGMIVGPYGLNLIKAIHEVELLSEIGIIFLLFIIGIEFSLKTIAAIRKTVLVGGILQVGGTIALTALGSWLIGLSLQEAVFMGFLVSLSSTAIVLKMLQERGELNAPHGRISVAILIFQDIIVVLMILLTPLLAGQMENPGITLLWLLLKVIIIVVVVILLARFIVPTLLGFVVKTRSQELFILTVVVLCFATAWLTSAVGLSLALGAFFAGLIISESDYSHQATAHILPLRELFISFFFVSVGMLLDFSFFVNHILTIHLLVFGVIIIKMLIITISVFVLKYPPRTILLTALTIFQVGEFAFVLSVTGMRYDLLHGDIYQYFLAISILTMGATPFLINFAPRIVDYVLQTSLSKGVKSRLNIRKAKGVEAGLDEESFHDHLVIIGYGINGQNVARTAKKAGIPYVVIELDPITFNKAKEAGESIVYGDATSETLLRHIHIQEARVVVVAISEIKATRQIVQEVRKFTETAYLIVRTRYIREIEDIVRLGADEVIPEEFETSIEIFTRVMQKYLVPRNEIQGFINSIRSHNYEMLRRSPAAKVDYGDPELHVPDMEIATIPVEKGNSRIVGKKIGESEIRTHYGVTVVAIKRGEEHINNVTPDMKICQDDILYLIGSPNNICRINEQLMLE